MHEYAWASFGEDHRLLVERECLARQAPYPLNALHLNARLLTTFHLQLTQAPSLARTLQMLGLPPQEGHRAGDAAWSCAQVLAFFLARLRGRPEAIEIEPLVRSEEYEVQAEWKTGRFSLGGRYVDVAGLARHGWLLGKFKRTSR